MILLQKCSVRYIHQHIYNITDRYPGKVPLSVFLKAYFKKYPALGSRDRKMLSEMAYAWYRVSKAFSDKLSFDRKTEACLFLCETQVHQVLQFLRPGWQGKQDYFLPQKIALLEKEKIKADLNNLFPFDIDFSKGISKEEWLLSMLRQPDLFIRYRKNAKHLIKLLNERKIHFRQVSDTCFAFPNGTKLDTLLPEKDYTVQDASSQMTGRYFSPKADEQWWDCCSGAGGKSLLLKDIQPQIKLTATDKRDTILHNLKKRFSLYFNNVPETILLDVSDSHALEKKLKGRQFDHIICDVPCSGSGTWARTPEQLYFFDPGEHKKFPLLQKSILLNTSKHLKEGGRLFYITCSVFKEENEDVVRVLADMKTEAQTIIDGIPNNADSMFVAVIRK